MSDTRTMSQSVEPEENPRVLVAIDFSEDSKAAFRWAMKYADCAGLKPVLLHVVHDPVFNPGFYRPGKSDSMQPMQTVAESMMSDFLLQIKAENPELAAPDEIELRFVPGLPPSRIVEVSNLLNASLIVVGSRGITGLPHMLLGSVAERVVELASCPVVVVKATGSSRLGKKELKQQRKHEKKEKKRLKKMLGLEQEQENGGSDG